MDKKVRTEDVLGTLKNIANITVNALGLYTPDQMTKLLDAHTKAIENLVKHLEELEDRVDEFEGKPVKKREGKRRKPGKNWMFGHGDDDDYEYVGE